MFPVPDSMAGRPNEARSLPAQSSTAVRSATSNELELKKAIYHYGRERLLTYQADVGRFYRVVGNHRWPVLGLAAR